jgi:hypothetical protein
MLRNEALRTKHCLSLLKLCQYYHKCGEFVLFSEMEKYSAQFYPSLDLLVLLYQDKSTSKKKLSVNVEFQYIYFRVYVYLIINYPPISLISLFSAFHHYLPAKNKFLEANLPEVYSLVSVLFDRN